jgi:hypothetical protein
MRFMTMAADKLLSAVLPKTTAGACVCRYSVYTCYCRNHQLYKVWEGYCVGCSGSCGCIAPVCRVISSC